MIFTERKITVRKDKSCIDEPVILYRGDYEVSVTFTIMESKFRFKSGVNLVDSEKASFGQLAILAPYGGSVFSDIVKCEDGTVTFTLTKEMIDQIEEVGLYSFQIRLFDYYRESRVSIPPVEFGIEVREPVASEDHDNSVNNAIVGYSIAKISDALNEDVPDTFDANGQYNKTVWETGDRITEGKLNKIEDAIDTINQNEIADVAALDKRITNNFNVLDSSKADKNAVNYEVNSKVWGMANMGQDVKEAMTGGSVAVVGKNSVLAENIVNGQVTANKITNTTPCKNLIDINAMIYGCHYDGNTGIVTEGNSSGNLNCITPPIPCKPDANYYKNKYSNTVFWDSSMTYIGRVEGTEAGAFTTPSDASYMGLSFQSDDINEVMLHEGTTSSTYEKYAVVCNDYRVNELGISDVWLFNTSYLNIDRGINGEYILNVTENDEGTDGLRLYMTCSFGPQRYIKIPAGIYKLEHNNALKFNYNTNEFTVSYAGSASGDDFADISKGEILLLKVTGREITAGRLKDYIYNWLTYYKTEFQSFVFRSTTGERITQTKGDVNETDIVISFPSTGQLQFIFKNGLYHRHDISGDEVQSFTIPHNHMLIYNYRDKTISIRTDPDSLYQLRHDELLLAFNIYGTIVDGLLLPYISNTFDLLKTNILSVYDRYYETSGCTLSKTDTTFNFTVPLDTASAWRVYVLRTNITGNNISPQMQYASYIPKGDLILDENGEPIVDEAGEITRDTKATFVLPHNGMLLLNTQTEEFYTELMTDKRCISFGGTSDILLLLSINGNLVGGELAHLFNDRLLKQDIPSLGSEASKHDMGRLKFKFDVDPGDSYISSESMVDDELWVFPVSNDEGTNYIKATRYKMDFENNTATEVGSFTHNWGHVNSSAYNPWRDALICGNGSGSYTLMGQIFIFENASSFKDRTQVDRSEAVTIDIQEWGYKANVVWGESNMGRGDICYVINNDAQNVRKLQLGMGANDLGSGAILADRTDSQFNGTYQVLGEWTLPRIDVVQGSNYENGALYIGLGHNTAWYTKNHLHDDGTVTYETYKEKFYNADGTQLYCNMQGITVTDKYVILGLQGGNLSTNQIHVYHR